jgi:predicted sulfurtransferase
LYEEDFDRTTISFYQYFPIPDPVSFRDEMYRALNAMQVFGRIYVATEGINAQISVPTHLFEVFKSYLYSFKPLNGIRLNKAVNDNGKSFWVLKIKVREKVVADGIDDPSFSMENKGKYVNAQQMNELLESPDTIVIDMRNHYEFEVGHFDNAIEIPSDTFRDQLPMAAEMMQPHKDKNIIMYCTGGIRCEKASAYMLHEGFKNVFHLEGGVIHYANKIKEGYQPQMNLAPLMALADKWTGSNLSKGYEAPETEQQHALKVMQAQQMANQAQSGISDDEIKLAQLQLMGEANKMKADNPATPKVTAEQWKAASFGQRTADANKTIAELEDVGTSRINKIAMSGFVPGEMVSEKTKLLDQAQRNFINSVLRRESGAAISPSEFENAKMQYFPQPGDTQAVLAQKAQNRARTIEGLQLEGGNATSQFSQQAPASAPVGKPSFEEWKKSKGL